MANAPSEDPLRVSLMATRSTGSTAVSEEKAALAAMGEKSMWAKAPRHAAFTPASPWVLRRSVTSAPKPSANIVALLVFACRACKLDCGGGWLTHNLQLHTAETKWQSETSTEVVPGACAAAKAPCVG
eukprot:CAMPEP_0177282552 /NCGR_PEP_ID=MMETSP0367-20130122/71523_1 /TAXON_ID=447022 ORGANISM="Scrippsiella hangoei-like, Strain SHHI-4" /NCGR_SAMPLE_ID=MMETSP0367 /ASSEMBLY_ACC=CAM_ASM_000362 /LENGTH=127 /DNA_ID=CAMNT_0018739485 /DNA_START=201 /DNA_END=581 /DNA_ORIENTATION=-